MEVHDEDLCQRVLPKNGMAAKQYFTQASRVHTLSGEKDPTILRVCVGEGLSLDFCPYELFVVAEVEAFPKKQDAK